MTHAEIAEKLVKEMGADNGCTFLPTKSQMEALAYGVGIMQEAGCEFTDEDITTLTSGEHEEQKKYEKYKGFANVDLLINDIFDGPIKQ